MSTLKPTPAHLYDVVSVATGELEAYEAIPTKVRENSLFLTLESQVISSVLHREMTEPEKSLIVIPMLKDTNLYIARRPTYHVAIEYMSKKCTVISDDRSYLFDSIYEAIQYIMEKATYWAYWPANRPFPLFGRTIICKANLPYFDIINPNHHTKLCGNKAIKVTIEQTKYLKEHIVYCPVPNDIRYRQARDAIMDKSEEIKKLIGLDERYASIMFSSNFEELEHGKTYDIIEITF